MKKVFAIATIFFAFSLSAKTPSKLDFCKKYDFAGYIYLGITFSPEEDEKNDYLHFKQDGTFESVDKGKREKGTWEWDLESKSLYLHSNQAKKPLIMEVVKATNRKLTLLLKDEKGSIKLIFKSKL